MSVISIILLILYLIYLKARVEISAYLNLFNNDCEIRISLFFIEVFFLKLKIDKFSDGKAYLSLNGKRLDFSEVRENGNSSSALKTLLLESIDVIEFRSIDLELSVGVKNSASITAMILATVKSAFIAYMSYLFAERGVDIKERAIAKYNENEFIIKFNSIIALSIADIIFSAIRLLFSPKLTGVSKKEVISDNRA